MIQSVLMFNSAPTFLTKAYFKFQSFNNNANAAISSSIQESSTKKKQTKKKKKDDDSSYYYYDSYEEVSTKRTPCGSLSISCDHNSDEVIEIHIFEKRDTVHLPIYKKYDVVHLPIPKKD